MRRVRRQVENWTVDTLYKRRDNISFPEYQREPNLWPNEKKSLLIDSIRQDIDIPKLYFNRVNAGFEVIDGQQRLWAIWGYLNDEFPHKSGDGSKKFSQLTPTERSWILQYPLQITVIEDASEEYLRELFVRLQLGLLLITGEKLNASTGAMRDFVFKKLVKHPFIQTIAIPSRRFAKETLCAQICINSFARAKLSEFARTRFEDLHFFFSEYQAPKGEDAQIFKEQTKKIADTLDTLHATYAAKAGELRNRSFIVSVYLYFEEHADTTLKLTATRAEFVKFTTRLWERLKAESRLGIDRTNRELYSFQTLMSSAPGERYQIERRNAKLHEYFEHFLKTKTIKGDKK